MFDNGDIQGLPLKKSPNTKKLVKRKIIKAIDLENQMIMVDQ